jgi:hypothetical protein
MRKREKIQRRDAEKKERRREKRERKYRRGKRVFIRYFGVFEQGAVRASQALLRPYGWRWGEMY